MRAAFFTLGCKVNQYETEVLIQQFSAHGFDIVEPEEEADVYVVNSCTVTASGDKKSRQMLRRFKKNNPVALACLCGCFPQAFPDVAEKIPEADVIMGSANRMKLLEAVNVLLATGGGNRIIDIAPHGKGEQFEPMSAGGLHARTRAFVKIEDGCERFCTYCIIPKARGPVRSKTLESLQAELAELATAGHREAVLVGINLSSYGVDLGLRLLDAVRLACSIDGIERVRLGSLEPELLTGQDIESLAKLPKLCPQFHLSLQSGCDETLKRMGRHYDTNEYRRIVSDLRAHFPNCAITTDIMVGFPGETEEEFAQSVLFLEEIGFSKAHVFAYSLRPGTAAAKLPGHLDNSVKSGRSKKMLAAEARSRRAFLARQVGTATPVLFESMGADGRWTGYTSNYTPVVVPSTLDLAGKLRQVNITGVEADGEACSGWLAGEELLL